MLGREILNREHAAVGGRRGLYECFFHRAPDNHLHQVRGVRFPRRNGRQPTTVAKDGNSVSDAENLVEAVGDIDDANVVGAQSFERFQQSLDVGLRQRRGWFVENNNVRLDRQCPANGDKRALGRRKRGNRRVGVEIAAHDRERLGRGVPDAPPRYETYPRAWIASLNSDVFGDGHPFDEAEVLMNERDGQRIRCRTRRLSGEFYGAWIGLVNARQDFDECGFAGAILAEQRVYLAATNVKVDMIESKRRSQSFDEAAHNEERRGLTVPTGSFELAS